MKKEVTNYLKMYPISFLDLFYQFIIYKKIFNILNCFIAILCFLYIIFYPNLEIIQIISLIFIPIILPTSSFFIEKYSKGKSQYNSLVLSLKNEIILKDTNNISCNKVEVGNFNFKVNNKRIKLANIHRIDVINDYYLFISLKENCIFVINKKLMNKKNILLLVVKIRLKYKNVQLVASEDKNSILKITDDRNSFMKFYQFYKYTYVLLITLGALILYNI